MGACGGTSQGEVQRRQRASLLWPHGRRRRTSLGAVSDGSAVHRSAFDGFALIPRVCSTRSPQLGAIRFDQDLRFVMGYLNGQVHASVGLRERFTRLQQIATLLNLDAEEDLDEFYNGSGIAWRVSIAEARAVIGLRV